MNESPHESIPNLLVQQASQTPAALALGAGGQESSWADLYRRVGRLAGQLQGLGVGPGHRVALLMGNGAGFVELVHALLQLRAVLVPLNLRLSAAELGWQLADVGASLLIYDARRQGLAEAASKTLPGLNLLAHSNLPALPQGSFEPPLTLELADLHTIIYSSGTTGRPKGVCLTLGNHWANAQASYQNLPAGPTDRWLAVLPLFHVGGLAIILRGLFYAMPVIVHESFDPEAVNRAIEQEGVTLVSVVTQMLSRMLDARADRPYPPGFRYALAGGGPVPAPLLQRCARAGIPVVQTYGMTETASQAVTLAPAEALRKLGSAGRPLPGVEVRIEQDGQSVVADEAGEIVLRGLIVTPGYADRPTETARAWRGGWFHTGDLGRLDPEGFLYVLDRRDDLIISGGENIYPAEIEAVLLSHPAIEEAGVVGLPSERWGQVPVAFVRLRPGLALNEAEASAYAAERLARYKVPTSFYFEAEALPRNAAGKLLRRVLRERLPA